MKSSEDEIKVVNSRFRGLIKRLPSNSHVAIVVAVIFGGVGAFLLVNSRAATPTASTEVETGTVSTAASKVNDNTASGGQAVKYGTPSSGGGGVTFNTCNNPTYTLPANPSNPQDGITLSGYYVDTDTWNFAKYPSSQQTMYVCNYNNWYAMVNVSDTANNGEVKTYPNVHKDYNSPAISTFNSITSIFAHTAPNYGDYDMAYDVWLNGLNYEIMIWTQSSGRQAHVPGIPKVATATIGGLTFDVHRSGTYIAYDLPNATNSGNVNVLQIINDAVTRGYVPSTATLTAIDYGAEICNTTGISTKFEINNFSVTSN